VDLLDQDSYKTYVSWHGDFQGKMNCSQHGSGGGVRSSAFMNVSEISLPTLRRFTVVRFLSPLLVTDRTSAHESAQRPMTHGAAIHRAAAPLRSLASSLVRTMIGTESKPPINLCQ
jgi:hypothetical protein